MVHSVRHEPCSGPAGLHSRAVIEHNQELILAARTLRAFYFGINTESFGSGAVWSPSVELVRGRSEGARPARGATNGLDHLKEWQPAHQVGEVGDPH